MELQTEFCDSHAAASRSSTVEHMGIDPERCAHPGCCQTRPMYCISHLHGQHDPMSQQMAEAHMHTQDEHMHTYAELHSIQQLQQQSEVRCGSLIKQIFFSYHTDCGVMSQVLAAKRPAGRL